MFNTIDFQMVLVADESKVSAKGHDEILDVLNDALFYNSFVDIYFSRSPISSTLIKSSRYSSLNISTARRASLGLLMVLVKLLGMRPWLW